MAHVSQNELLATKADEIQEQLEIWVRDQKLLLAGQQISFSMKILDVPLIIQHGSGANTSILDMKIMDLLTTERLVQHTSPGVASRVRRQLPYGIGNDAMSVRDFLDSYPTERRLGHFPNIGRKSVVAIANVLRGAGLVFND